ncbi:amino acid ABC transporter substrate-binding protein [Marinobacterium zhoushanense]|uniref:amino acid ABC transporter substrate-binding protein n=1 Tax=Marinobacterium zhoushanense TaxID=1679163 RepID=UPI001E5C9284|nr:amino acid ABC transporter substrate-binding protein [Marinobacterium zhoushanense]
MKAEEGRVKHIKAMRSLSGSVRRGMWGAFGALALLSLPVAAAETNADAARSTLQRVQSNGDLRCGVYPDDPGRSAITTSGVWAGFYVDFCKAVAAAVIGNPDFVQYVEVGATTRFTSLVEDKTDVVMYSSTWTLGRESTYNVEFPTIYLFDGQGFLVRKRSGIGQLDDLKGKSICVTENTTTHRNLMQLNEQHGLDAKVLFSNGDSFFRGSCDAYSADRMNLATNRANRADNPDDYLILPDVVSREPIGPTVRNDDPQWSRIVRSVVHAVILAEEKGITQDNVDSYLNGEHDAEVDNLLGNSGDIGAQLGLNKAWAYRAIKAVGNYGEIYDRHFGPDTPIGVERGLNRLWSRGGLLFAPPFK